MTIHMTAQMALDGIDKAVEQRGEDYVYAEHFGPECQYVDAKTAEPCCIVGQVLADAGVEMDIFLNVSNTYRIARLEEHLESVITFDKKAMNILNAVQDFQDHGRSWGQARDTTKGMISYL